MTRPRTTPLPATVTALDAARQNLALAEARGWDAARIAHLAANVERERRLAAGITDLSDIA